MFGKFCFRVFVGLVAAIVISGGAIIPTIVMTVVCTMGIGLIVVLPAAYLIGLVITIAFVPFGTGGWRYRKHPVAAAEKPLEPRITGLAVYIAKMLRADIPWKTCRKELIQCGWTDSEVDAAYAIARPQTSDSKTP